MTRKYLQEPLLWKRGYTNGIDSYTGPDGEVTLDYRNGKIAMRVHDNVTVGGVLQENAISTGILQPSITSPITGTTGLSINPTFTSSAFLGIAADKSKDTHASSDWEVATDAGFTNVIFSSISDAVNLTQLDMSTVVDELPYGTQLYVRVRYNGNSGAVSPWSPMITFTTVNALNGTEIGTVIAADGLAYDYGAASVSISPDGAMAIVSAHGATANSVTDSGKVYVYDIDPITGIWTEQQQITANTPANTDYFGTGLVLSADKTMALIGAYAHNSYNGKVYVYDIDPITNIWTFQQQIVASDTAAGNSFGISVALSVDKTMALIGAHSANHTGLTDAGKVYVYDIDPVTNTWTEQQQVAANAPASGDKFGIALDLSQDKTTVLVGADGKNNGAFTNNGSVYVYDIDPVTNTWTEQQQIVASDMETEGKFGSAVALSADKTMALIGAHGATVLGVTGAGKVYIYDIDTATNAWVERQQIAASDPQTNAFFGDAISMLPDKTLAVIGASFYDVGQNSDVGKLYIFD